ncbi:hypothetical protein HRbin40_02546 [bacterium HR40]|nr:hypothetical protein HRbin40_02546 [bacterium HR40]
MTMMARRSTSRSWIPFLFVAGFLVVLVANAAMIGVGIATWPGLVTDHAYERGLQFQRELARAEAQKALGWQIEWQATGGAAGATLVLALHDREGRPIDTAEVRASFVRPTAEGHDFVLSLAPRGEGRFEASFRPPLPGLWDVELEIWRGEDSWTERRRLFLR